MKQFELVVVDNELLKGYAWEIENPKACIVIFEGMEEHVSRYDEFALFLNKNGYSVYGLDTYGQGLNVKEDLSNIGEWPNEGFAKQVIANNLLINQIKEQGKPVYIFAHSMGSFMAQDYMQRFSGSVEKIALSGSGYKQAAMKPGYLLAKMLTTKKNRNQKGQFLSNLMFGSFNKKIPNNKTAFDWLSVNEENVQTYIADPLCGFGSKNGFIYEFLKGLTRLYNKNSLKKISKDQKIFLITGSEDPVSNYGKFTEKLIQMYNKLGIKNVSKKIYPGERHELLNEDVKQEVMDDVLNFFNA